MNNYLNVAAYLRLSKEEFNNYLEELKEKWICADGINAKVEDIELTGENGKLTMAVCTAAGAPFVENTSKNT